MISDEVVDNLGKAAGGDDALTSQQLHDLPLCRLTQKQGNQRICVEQCQSGAGPNFRSSASRSSSRNWRRISSEEGPG